MSSGAGPARHHLRPLLALSFALTSAASCSTTTNHPGDDVTGGQTGGSDSGAVGVGDSSTAPDAADSSVARDGQTAGDTGSGTDGAAPICNTLANDAPLVTETTVPGARADGMGGDIPPGKYFLTERDWYPDAGEDPTDEEADLVLQRVLVIDATSVNEVDGEGSTEGGALVQSLVTSTYAVLDDVELSRTATCPAPGKPVNVIFTVQGNQLWFYTDGQHRQVYTMQ